MQILAFGVEAWFAKTFFEHSSGSIAKHSSMHDKVAASRERMNRPLRRLLGVIGIGLSWGAVWAAVFATFVRIIGIVRPEDIDPGEGPLVAGGIGLIVGFVSGGVFGCILSFAENRKSIRDLALARVVIWGIVASAVWPLLTPLPNSMMFILCPLGAMCASAFLAISRRGELYPPVRPTLVGRMGRVLASPLRAACASNE